MQDTSQPSTTKQGHRINAVAIFKRKDRNQRKGTNEPIPNGTISIFKYGHKTYYYYQRKQKMTTEPGSIDSHNCRINVEIILYAITSLLEIIKLISLSTIATICITASLYAIVVVPLFASPSCPYTSLLS